MASLVVANPAASPQQRSRQRPASVRAVFPRAAAPRLRLGALPPAG